MKKGICFGAVILGFGLASACNRQGQQVQPPPQSQTTQREQRAYIEEPGKGFDIKVASVTRTKRYESAKLKELGVSPNPQVVAPPGHELAIVRISVKRTTEGATLRLGVKDGQEGRDEKESDLGGGVRQLGAIRAYDADGKKYSYTVIGQTRVGYEFVFVVPVGTKLRTIELAEGLSLDLK